MLNAISVDVEDYFHAANLDVLLGPSRWDSLPARADIATEKVLALFDRCHTKATFFVLGHTASKFPDLVRKIQKEKHEIASHGFGHRLVYSQSPEQFFDDISRSKKLLEDLTGSSIIGYRAPNFSITDRAPWAYDKLLDAGFRYDSSVFPTLHPRYSNINKPRTIYEIKRDRGTLIEVPLAVGKYQIGKWNLPLPVAGGAYWRLLPLRYNLWGLNQLSNEGLPAICYFHPWELDPGQPRFDNLSWLTKIRHYGGIAGFEGRIEKILRTFNFGPIREIIGQWLK